MASRKLRVLVVDDSPLVREVVSRGIAADAGMEVVATAANPFEARDRIEEYEPDVMALDVEMPRMNGIEFLRLLMPQYPMPVVVMSAVGGNVFDAMAAGAIDFVTKPDALGAEGRQAFVTELVVKLKIASTAKVGVHKHHPGTVRRVGRGTGEGRGIVAIGASTGGTEAIQEVLSSFEADCPPIVIVQHMPPVFTRMYAERLNRECRMEVREARDHDAVRPGLVLVAPGDRHMRLRRSGDGYIVRCEAGEKVSGHCPSVDVLFDSVAREAGRDAVGALLTGMGADGARGLLAMRQTGARTLGQDPESCVVYGMPMEAWKLGAVDRQVSLEQMAEAILEACGP